LLERLFTFLKKAIGLEVYEKQLRMAGKEALAKKVNNYRTAKGLS
jgi:hypothetical protein